MTVLSFKSSKWGGCSADRDILSTTKMREPKKWSQSWFLFLERFREYKKMWINSEYALILLSWLTTTSSLISSWTVGIWDGHFFVLDTHKRNLEKVSNATIIIHPGPREDLQGLKEIRNTIKVQCFCVSRSFTKKCLLDGSSFRCIIHHSVPILFELA